MGGFTAWTIRFDLYPWAYQRNDMQYVPFVWHFQSFSHTCKYSVTHLGRYWLHLPLTPCVTLLLPPQGAPLPVSASTPSLDTAEAAVAPAALSWLAVSRPLCRPLSYPDTRLHMCLHSSALQLKHARVHALTLVRRHARTMEKHLQALSAQQQWQERMRNEKISVFHLKDINVCHRHLAAHHKGFRILWAKYKVFPMGLFTPLH